MARVVGNDHWVMFGDGNMCLLLSSREVLKKNTGQKYYRFILQPSDRVKSMYDLDEEIDPESGCVIREYSVHDVIFLERAVTRTRAWVLTDFNGDDTPASRRYSDLTQTLKDTEKLLRSVEAAKNRMMAELTLERTQRHQSVRLQSKIIQEVAKARSRVDGDMGDEGEVLPE